MKKVVENNTDKSCDNSDESSCDISDNELTVVVNEEKPTKNKKKVTTEK